MVEAGVEQIAIVVRDNGFNAIEAFLNASVAPPAGIQHDPLVCHFERLIRSAQFSFIVQEGSYGNGRPLLSARDFIGGEPCIYAFADDVVIGQNATAGLIDIYNRRGHAVLTAQAISKRDVSKFGIIECHNADGVDYVTRFVEKPQPHETSSRLASLGRYLVPWTLLDVLGNTPLGRNGELWLSDAFVSLLENGSHLAAHGLTEGRWFTVGNPTGFADAVRAAIETEHLFK
jgi:UTP--glucose-1-phosphate uridylyltransferase